MGWSAAAAALWGKTDREDGSWLPLVQHLEDSRLVAGHLWDTWLPRIVRDRIASVTGEDPAAGRALVCFMAAIHDVGKATPAFATQVYDQGTLDHVLEPAKAAGLTCQHLARSQRKDFHHTVTGQAIVHRWLVGTHGFHQRRSAVHAAGIVGGHHGMPLSSAQHHRGLVEHDAPRSAAFGDDAWRRVQIEILEEMAQRTDAGRVLQVIRDGGLPLTVQMDLTAIVILADWLASDAGRFPYDLSVTPEERWAAGMETLDLAPPWEPTVDDDDVAMLETRFPHLRGKSMNAVQKASLQIASEIAQPPLMIIEAPMGHGKTESALLAAERLASRFGTGGVFFGLPTMATSDGMFERVLTWLENGSPGSRPSVYLAHSKAGLNDHYRGLVSTAFRTQGVYDDENGIRATPVVDLWTRGRKKGVLASMVVGTIDQALFGALQTKHLALRHLALTGKVVVIDEVHAADDYMRSYLCRVLEWLGRYGTPVVLMSATLPTAQRRQLAVAYQRGRGGRVDDVPPVDGYPCITTVTDEVVAHAVLSTSSSLAVGVEFVNGDEVVIADRIAAELDEGGCAAVIVNTVGRAQKAYEHLAGAFPSGEVVLVHSRFIGPHRMTKEAHLRGALGPPSPQRERPRRLVVVGTQVLEQSLDIDVDLMLTDIAPIDLVLQRVGRLHRHERSADARPERLRRPRLLVAGAGTTPSLETPPTFEAGSVAVYSQHRLLRACEALLSVVPDGLRLPQDIPRLVEMAYDEQRSAPHSWAEAWTGSAAEAHVRRRKAVSAAEAFQLPSVEKQGSVVDLLPAAVPAESDDLERTGRAQVRDSDDSLEVMLAVRDDDGLVRVMDGVECGGRVVPSVLGGHDAPVARALAASTVRLPRSLTHPGIIDQAIEELEREPLVSSWQSDPHLAGQLLVLINRAGEGTLLHQRISYDAIAGLTVEPSGEGTA